MRSLFKKLVRRFVRYLLRTADVMVTEVPGPCPFSGLKGQKIELNRSDRPSSVKV